MKIKIKQVARHRNGVGGAPFYVVLFNASRDDGPSDAVAIVFEGRGQVAVLSAGETARGNVAFARGNSWRGDHFEPELRAAVADYERDEEQRWAAKVAARKSDASIAQVLTYAAHDAAAGE